MIKDLLLLFPEHHTYVEVFGGAGHLLCAKQPSAFEVFNDLDSNLMNFFEVVANPETFTDFHRRVALLPHSRELFHKLRDQETTEFDNVTRAVNWFYVMRFAFGGSGSGGRHSNWGYACNVYGTPGLSSGYLAAVKLLPALHQRLQGVQLDHRDFRAIFKAYDAPYTFFFCDPTYLAETRKLDNDHRGHAHMMSLEDHEDLIETLRSLEGKALVTHYPHPLYESLAEAGWIKREVKKNLWAAGKTKGANLKGAGAMKNHQATECIWLNPQALQSGGMQVAFGF